MLKYKLKNSINGALTYYYYPEGKMDSPGEVIFYPNGEKEVARESEDDVKNYMHFMHFLGLIKRKKLE